jgi:hypothetical protein
MLLIAIINISKSNVMPIEIYNQMFQDGNPNNIPVNNNNEIQQQNNINNNDI